MGLFQLQREIDLIEFTENFAANWRTTSINRAFEKLLPITDIFMLHHFTTPQHKIEIMYNAYLTEEWTAPGGNQTETNKTYIILSSMRQV